MHCVDEIKESLFSIQRNTLRVSFGSSSPYAKRNTKLECQFQFLGRETKKVISQEEGKCSDSGKKAEENDVGFLLDSVSKKIDIGLSYYTFFSSNTDDNDDSRR